MQKIFYLLILCLLQPKVFAMQSCPAFLNVPQHTLRQVILYNREGANIYELAPTMEQEMGQVAKLRWDELEKSDLPTYFKCSYYHTKQVIQGRLWKTTQRCWHLFPYVKGVVLEKGERRFYCK